MANNGWFGWRFGFSVNLFERPWFSTKGSSGSFRVLANSNRDHGTPHYLMVDPNIFSERIPLLSIHLFIKERQVKRFLPSFKNETCRYNAEITQIPNPNSALDGSRFKGTEALRRRPMHFRRKNAGVGGNRNCSSPVTVVFV